MDTACFEKAVIILKARSRQVSTPTRSSRKGRAQSWMQDTTSILEPYKQLHHHCSGFLSNMNEEELDYNTKLIR
jgi:hypothetical protein